MDFWRPSGLWEKPMRRLRLPPKKPGGNLGHRAKKELRPKRDTLWPSNDCRASVFSTCLVSGEDRKL